MSYLPTFLHLVFKHGTEYRRPGCKEDGFNPLSRHVYSDVLNVETLPMGLVHVVLQGGEEETSGEKEGIECMGKKERYGVEWGRGMVKLP